MTFMNDCNGFYRWIEACIEDELPTTTELEEALRNGVILCRLGHFYAPEILPLRKIYDRDQAKYHVREIIFVFVNSVHQHSYLDTWIHHTAPYHSLHGAVTYMGGTHFYTSTYSACCMHVPVTYSALLLLLPC